MIRRLITAVQVLIFLTGCSIVSSPAPVSTTEPSAAGEPATATWTASLEPSPTAGQTATPEPSPTAGTTVAANLSTPASGSTLSDLAVVQARRLNLRSGPGTVFPVLDSLEEGVEVAVIGKALGDQWIRIEIPTEEEDETPGLTGWVLADLLGLSTPIQYLGYIEVIQSWLVEGKVLDEYGVPVDRVSIAITQGMGADELRTDASTLENGRFYAYLPWDTVGIWQVSVSGVECSSRLMLDDCQLQAGYYLSIPQVNIEVPSETPVLLLFAYSEGGVHGTVYVEDEVQEGIRVRGESAAGAVSWDFTESDGSYHLALGEGVWTVYAVDDAGGSASERMTVALGAGQLLTDVDIEID